MWRILHKTARRPDPQGVGPASDPRNLRLAIVGFVFLIAFAALWSRLVYIQTARHEYYAEEAKKQQFTEIPVMPRRGRIFDRLGRDVAISKFMHSVYIEPGRITRQREAVALKLGEAFGVPHEDILAKLLKYADTKACVPIARKLEPEVVAPKVRETRCEFRLPRYAIDLRQDSKRAYPRQQFAAHVLGGTQMDDSGDNIGAEGIEKQYDEYLRGSLAKFTVAVTAIRQSLAPVDGDELLAAFGSDVTLTIDGAIQTAAERRLAQAVAEQRAVGGSIVVMACRDGNGYQSGAILAMANVPTFDPNRPAPAFTRRNRAVTDVVETGSVMKTFLAAILIEEGRLDPDETELIDCGGGRGNFNGENVLDAPGHEMDLAPFTDVYKYSSNVGSVAAAQRIAPSAYADWLRKFGFGAVTGIDFPGEASGTISIRRPVDRDRAAIGYSVSVTALQVAAALCAIGNDGFTVQPHLVRWVKNVRGQTVYRFERDQGRKVIEPLTAKKARSLMESVVEGGTGVEAQVPGYRVGGKTGTARKYDPVTGGYGRSAYIASFACLAPIDKPQIAIYCYIDEPKKGRYGGPVAGPVVRDVAHVALRAIGLLPAPSDEEPRKDFDLIVEPIRTTRKEHIYAALSATSRRNGRMPDLRGMTMAEAHSALKSLPLKKVEFKGSGIVVKQEPEPDALLRDHEKASIGFADTSP